MPQTDAIPVSASIASVGKSIRYIGDHCYAYSGAIEASDSIQTLLDFTTGSGFIVATLTMTAPVRMTTGDVASGYVRGWQLDFNSQTVGLYKADTAQEDMPTMVETDILIPSLTHVILTCVDSAATVNWKGTATLAGRVYGAE